MPPRIVVALIVAFWLASTGWLGYHYWWRWLGTDNPPPVTVELADEAVPQTAQWSIWRGGRKVGKANTSMKCLKDSTLELQSTIDQFEIELSFFNVTVKVKVPKI